MAFIKTPLLDATKQKADAAKKAQEWTRITGKPVPTSALSSKTSTNISTPVLDSAKAKTTSVGIGFGFSPTKKEFALETIGRYLGNSSDATTPLAPINSNPETQKAAQYVAGKAASGAIGSAKGLVNEVGYLGQAAAQGLYASESAKLKMRDAGKAAPSPVTTQMQDTAKALANTPLKTSVNWGQNYNNNLNQFALENKFDKDKGLQTIGNVAQGVGGMVPSIVSNFIVPGSSLFVMATGAAGNATEQAVANGADTGSALAYGAAVGVTEAATEKLFNGVAGIFGKGAADDILKSVVKRVSKDETVQKAVTALANTLGEGFEEWLTEYAEAYENKLLINQDSRNFKTLSQDALYSGMIGSLTSLVMQGGDVASLSATQAGEAAATDTLNNVQSTSQTPQNNVNILSEAVQVPTSDVANKPVTDTAKAVVANVTQPTTQNNAISAESSIGAKITKGMPQGTGAMSNPNPTKQGLSQTEAHTLLTNDIIENVPKEAREPATIDTVSELESMNRAQQRVDLDIEGEKADLSSKNSWTGEDIDAAMLIREGLVFDAMKSGDWGEYKKWRKTIALRGADAGRSLQALKKWTRGDSAEKLVDSVAKLFDDVDGLSEKVTNKALGEVADRAYKVESQYKTGDKDGILQSVTEIAKQRGYAPNKRVSKILSEMDTEQLYDVAWKEIEGIAFDEIPPSLGQKISTYQYMSHLLNAKSIERNIIANSVFAPLDRLANNISLIPDALTSFAMGGKSWKKYRSVGYEKNYLSKEARKGVAEGAKQSIVDIELDINRGGKDNKYQQSTGKTFNRYQTTPNTNGKVTLTDALLNGKYGVKNIPNNLESVLGYSLSFPDAVQKGATKGISDQALKPLVKNGGRITADMADKMSEREQDYRSFQRDTIIGNILQAGKDYLNIIGVGTSTGKTKNIGPLKFQVKDFGVGDFVNKYARVPGAIATTTAEFTPLGYAKALYNLTAMANANKKVSSGFGDVLSKKAGYTDMTNSEAAVFAQRDFAQSIGRAATGTGLIMACKALAGLGILVFSGDDDPDKNSLFAALGLSKLQMNLSALERLITGENAEIKDGDTLVSMNNLEPINGVMEIGARMDNMNDATFAKKSDAVLNGVFNSLGDLSMMQNLRTTTNAFRYKKDEETWGDVFGRAALGVVGSGATGFIPAPLRQTAQAGDEYQRDTSADNKGLQILNSLKSGIPGLRETLPTKTDSMGNPKTNGGNTLNVLNSFFAPGNIVKYKQSGVVDEILRLDGVVDNMPYPDSKAPNTIEDGGNPHKLTSDEKAQYQKTSGKLTYDLMQTMIDGDAYSKMTDEQKADALSKVMGYAEDKAKREYLESKGQAYKSNSNEYENVYEAEQAGINPSDYFAFKSKLNEIDDNGSITQLESTQAIEATDLSSKYKGELWAIQNSTANPEKNPYTGSLAQQGLSAEKNIEIMEARKQYTHKVDFVAWLESVGYNEAQINAIWEGYKNG